MLVRRSNNRNSHSLLGSPKWYRFFRSQFGGFHRTIYTHHNIQQSHSQRRWKLMSTQNTCRQMFTATLFIIVQIWKQSLSCPSVGECINWFTHKMNLFSTWKNEPSNQAKIWRKLKCILLSERRQPEKALCCMIPTILHSRKVKTIETIKIKMSGCQGLEGGRDEEAEYKGSLLRWNWSVWYYNGEDMSI